MSEEKDISAKGRDWKSLLMEGIIDLWLIFFLFPFYYGLKLSEYDCPLKSPDLFSFYFCSVLWLIFLFILPSRFSWKKLGLEFLEFSGIRFVFEKKWFPSFFDKDKNSYARRAKPKTIVFWLIAVYLGLFSIADVRFSKAVDLIEFRINAVLNQLAKLDRVKNKKEIKAALERIPDIQRLWCPRQPNIRLPYTVFLAYFFQQPEGVYEETAKVLRDTVEDYKEILEEVNLSGAWLISANLKNAELKNAILNNVDLANTDLEDADLEGVNLEGVNNLTIEQLCKAKTLHRAILDDDLKKKVRKNCPHLLEKPKDNYGHKE